MKSTGKTVKFYLAVVNRRGEGSASDAPDEGLMTSYLSNFVKETLLSKMPAAKAQLVVVPISNLTEVTLPDCAKPQNRNHINSYFPSLLCNDSSTSTPALVVSFWEAEVPDRAQKVSHALHAFLAADSSKGNDEVWGTPASMPISIALSDTEDVEDEDQVPPTIDVVLLQDLPKDAVLIALTEGPIDVPPEKAASEPRNNVVDVSDESSGNASDVVIEDQDPSLSRNRGSIGSTQFGATPTAACNEEDDVSASRQSVKTALKTKLQKLAARQMSSAPLEEGWCRCPFDPTHRVRTDALKGHLEQQHLSDSLSLLADVAIVVSGESKPPAVIVAEKVDKKLVEVSKKKRARSPSPSSSSSASTSASSSSRSSISSQKGLKPTALTIPKLPSSIPEQHPPQQNFLMTGPAIHAVASSSRVVPPEPYPNCNTVHVSYVPSLPTITVHPNVVRAYLESRYGECIVHITAVLLKRCFFIDLTSAAIATQMMLDHYRVPVKLNDGSAVIYVNWPKKQARPPVGEGQPPIPTHQSFPILPSQAVQLPQQQQMLVRVAPQEALQTSVASSPLDNNPSKPQMPSRVVVFSLCSSATRDKEVFVSLAGLQLGQIEMITTVSSQLKSIVEFASMDAAERAVMYSMSGGFAGHPHITGACFGLVC